MSLNLRPAVVARRQELERRRPFFVMAAAAIVLAVFGWGFYCARAAQVIHAGADRIKKINTPMRAAEEKIDKLRQQAGVLDAVTVPLVAAINDRFFWVQLLEDLNARLPKEDIWITELMPTSGGKPVDFEDKHAIEPAPAQTSPGSKPEVPPGRSSTVCCCAVSIYIIPSSRRWSSTTSGTWLARRFSTSIRIIRRARSSPPSQTTRRGLFLTSFISI